MTFSKVASSLLAAALFTSSVPAFALTPDEAKSIALDAYVYGYSLLTTEVTRVQMTHAPEVSLATMKVPMGEIINVPRYPPVGERRISAPNADTLYSIVWMDLSEPQVFSQPDMGSRWFTFEGVDLWMTDLENSPSRRTNGGKAGNYLFTGPGWNGTVPEGMHHIPMATRYMGILGRTYADGTEQDFKIVNDLQAKLKVTPLSAWGKDYTPKAPALDAPPFSLTDTPQKVILDMGTAGYFNMMARLMCKDAPAAAVDAPIIEKMAQIGLKPCEKFDLEKLDAQTQAALKDLPQQALAKIEANYKTLGEKVNGWNVALGLGSYGTDYLKRATVAAYGWPAQHDIDGVYPYTDVDSAGQPLSGANKYTVTFAAGKEPPVNGFWSITMYEIEKGWWFYPNALNKFTVSQRNDFRKNADGSVTLYFQHESPGAEKQANWLPAPDGPFVLMMRLYGPSENNPTILNGSWQPPAVAKVN
ncbi:DUF1254 domain-containing protein [Chelatococcus asaccharovorans]|uniref:DUF1254 domain-containing protein n=1 Tax=Chelatococcus asaccharovorans TaxID=28210 RepID=UPI00224C7559|nr:DUF1214 domain-containing protein [Chelatococcus asaccharovorans]CAH1661106.1 conserved exported hypothetical protein [Chelatococcus asaccharovorans]CAH1690020.1 conserved exported hypothetical protein [Chelatococcus asaccharovorans]